MGAVHPVRDRAVPVHHLAHELLVLLDLLRNQVKRIIVPAFGRNGLLQQVLHEGTASSR